MADVDLNELLASIQSLKSGFTEADKALVLDAIATAGDKQPVLSNLLVLMENLKEADARTIQNYDGIEATFKNEGERYRAWEFATAELLDGACEYLRRYAWVKGDNPVRRKFVDAPLIDGTALPGKWRVIGVRKVAFQGKYYVIEILRKGYATQIDWTEAFLVEGHNPRTNEDARAIEFRYFDPVCVQAAVLALEAASPFTDPAVQAQTIAGSWAATDIVPKPEQDGSYTITLILKNLTGTSFRYKSLSTIYRSGNTIVYRNWASPVDAPSTAGSGMYRVQNTRNDDGAYDAVLIYENGIGSSSTEFKSLSTMFRSGNTILYKNWPAKIVAPAATGSGMYRAQNSINDDATFDGSLIYENGTASGSAEFRSLSTIFRSGNTILYKSWPSIITAPSATGSGIYRVQQSLQDDGTYDAVLLYENGSATGSSAFKSLSTLFRSGNTILYKSWPSVITSPDAGSGIYRLQQSLQDDGTYDASLVYEARAASSFSLVTLRSTLSTVTSGIYRSQPSVQEPGAAEVGKRILSTIDQDDTGLYDEQVQIQESGPASFLKSWQTYSGPAYMYQYRNWSSAVAISDDNYNITSSSSVNDDGTYDTVISITTPSSTSSDWSDESSHKTYLYDLYGPKGISSASPGRYRVYVYLRKTYSKADSDVTAKMLSPDTGYVMVPTWGNYHSGISPYGRKMYIGVVVLQRYPATS